MAIGLEAFNKFAQEEQEKMKREQEKEEEQRKITGRFLLKGVVDMLADTFATSNQWVCPTWGVGLLLSWKSS